MQWRMGCIISMEHVTFPTPTHPCVTRGQILTSTGLIRAETLSWIDSCKPSANGTEKPRRASISLLRFHKQFPNGFNLRTSVKHPSSTHQWKQADSIRMDNARITISLSHAWSHTSESTCSSRHSRSSIYPF